MLNKSRWAVFVSGTGSNLEALLKNPYYGQNIKLVVSSRKTNLGNIRAQRKGKKVLFFSKKNEWSELYKYLVDHGIESIALLGFMRLIPKEFIELWGNRPLLNLHPSLLPLYPGKDSMSESFNEKSKMGVSFHIVTEGMDEGPILAQRSVVDLGSANLRNIKEHQLLSFESVKVSMHLAEQKLVKAWFGLSHFNLQKRILNFEKI